VKIEEFIKFGMQIHWLRCVDPKNPSQPEKKNPNKERRKKCVDRQNR
jgi:hypothetical protein